MNIHSQTTIYWVLYNFIHKINIYTTETEPLAMNVNGKTTSDRGHCEEKNEYNERISDRYTCKDMSNLNQLTLSENSAFHGVVSKSASVKFSFEQVFVC